MFCRVALLESTKRTICKILSVVMVTQKIPYLLLNYLIGALRKKKVSATMRNKMVKPWKMEAGQMEVEKELKGIQD